MPFTALIFLSVFLPAYMLVVVVTRGTVANWTILGLSLLFYLWGAEISFIVDVYRGDAKPPRSRATPGCSRTRSPDRGGQ